MKPIVQLKTITAGLQSVRYKMFGQYGRINRGRYMAWLAGSFILLSMLFIIVLIASSKKIIPFSLLSVTSVLDGYLILLVVSFMVITLKRVQDFGGTAWYMLLLFIPIVNLFALIAFISISGDKQLNSYGPVPPTLSIIEKLFVGLFFCLAIIPFVLFGVFIVVF